MRRRFGLAAAALLALAAPAHADEFATGGAVVAIDPTQAGWRAVFAAIRSGEWATAQAGIDAAPADPLALVARAELLLARGTSIADLPALTALLAAAPDLPEAPSLAERLRALGGAAAGALPVQHELIRYAGASKRLAAQPTRADAAAQRLARAATAPVKANDGLAAEALVEAAASDLTPSALTEWRARVAWAYYLGGDDANARRVATLGRGGTGEWLAQAAWIGGLAAWRAGEKAEAADDFNVVAGSAHDPETIAAALFWQARAAGQDSALGQAALRSAARTGETFYGLLAATVLGIEPAPAIEATDLYTPDRANLRAATALAAIGETALADKLLRFQARIGDPAEHGTLVRTAERLGLVETQMWLAANGPPGGSAALATRFPTPAWSPSGGWRVDRALLLAHALQESRFRLDATSPAGARGLMQLMPSTARLVARHKGDTSGTAERLADPAISFEYGQSYLEELAANPITNHLLPKVIAAYNAGPNNVALWGLRPGMNDDPLLFIESIPFAETRAYVAIVLRNYWMYGRALGSGSQSRADLAAGRWPSFPTVQRPLIQARSDTGAVAASN